MDGRTSSSPRLDPRCCRHTRPDACGVGHTLQTAERGRDEDLLEATLTVRNESDQPQQIELVFITSVHLATDAQQQTYLPLNAAGFHR